MKLGLGYDITRFGFDVVHGCQLRCVGCPNSTLLPKVSCITPEDFDLCLSNVDVKRIKVLRLFNFGEPFLHSNLLEVIEQIPKQSFKVTIVEICTNAQVFDPELIEGIFRQGVVNLMVVSCDGDGTPEDFERLRPPGKWPKLMRFLEGVGQLRDKYAPHVPLHTRSICTEPEHQERWLSVLRPLGWEPWFRDWIHLPDTEGQPWSDFKAAEDVCAYMRRKDMLYCDADGTVVPCCWHPKAFPLGNLKEQKFSEIINGERHAEMVQLMATDRKSMDVCGSCACR